MFDSGWFYLLALTFSLVGLGLLDHRHRLAFFSKPRATALAILAGVIFFSFVDVLGIALGIFFRGSGPFLTGFVIAPEFPIEELFFLTLLSYNTLIAYAWLERRVLERRATARGAKPESPQNGEI